MTDMISMKPRSRRRTAVRIPAVTESARLREQMIRVAAGVQSFVVELREEVDRRIEQLTDEEDHGDD